MNVFTTKTIGLPGFVTKKAPISIAVYALELANLSADAFYEKEDNKLFWLQSGIFKVNYGTFSKLFIDIFQFKNSAFLK